MRKEKRITTMTMMTPMTSTTTKPLTMTKMSTMIKATSVEVERDLKDSSTSEDKKKTTADMNPNLVVIGKSSSSTMMLTMMMMITKEGGGEWSRDDQRKDDVPQDVVINMKYTGDKTKKVEEKSNLSSTATATKTMPLAISSSYDGRKTAGKDNDPEGREYAERQTQIRRLSNELWAGDKAESQLRSSWESATSKNHLTVSLNKPIGTN